ncbi:MAG TPA: branched-chain amino acid ABC transporter permease [Chloroflexota bacterium]|nr:branched-chain amino acid ABC transporter permease [Chloroflexota bacterium]
MVDPSVFVLLGINILMGWSFYVMLMSGQFSFGNAGFMALGAYTAGIATVKLGLPYGVGLLLAVVVGAVAGGLVGLPALRMRGVYLALATIAFAFLVENFFVNLEYTGAQTGFYGLTGTTLPGVYLCVAVLGVLLLRLQHSRLAKSLQAVREHEVVASTLGLNTTYLKLLSFSLGAAFAALAGALYGHYTYFISPELFGFFQSVWPAFYVAIGGAGTVVGPVLGAAIVTLLPEYFQPLQEWRLLVFGLTVMALIALRPQGLYTPYMQRRLGAWLRRLQPRWPRAAGRSPTAVPGDASPGAVGARGESP